MNVNKYLKFLKFVLRKKQFAFTILALFFAFLIIIPFSFILKLFLLIASIALSIKIWEEKKHFFLKTPLLKKWNKAKDIQKKRKT